LPTDPTTAEAMNARGASGAQAPLPVGVAELHARLSERHAQVLCLRIGEDYRLRETHGDATPFGLGGLLSGTDVRAAAPFLDHFDPTGRLTLPFVNLGEDRAVHLHVVPCAAAAGEQGGGGWYVLFADADQELAEQRESQQRENERRLRTQRLQGRLVQAAAEGQVWRDQAEEARAATWRLAGSLSHELKTPLSAILGYTRLLEEALSALPEQRQQVRVIEQSAEHITQLIDATLEQYRRDVTELTIHPRPTDVRELVASLTELMAPLAADKALGFAAFVAPTLPERLHTDGMRLRQVLLNLLGNAIKFTEEGWVRLDVHPQGEGLVLAVADSGPGIAPEHRERVFAAFDRAGRDETIGATGTGLGLHITQQIVARMGGTIDLESQVDRGSRFTVRVPAPAVAEADPAIRDEPVEPGRVLVAEDDLDLRVLFGVFLERAGFDTLFVTRGDEVVREGLAVPPQLVLMDLNLDGGVDGFTAAARLREGGYPGPILALSAGDAALEAEAIAAGCDGFLAKPVRPEQLLERVFDLLKRHR
jgi:signal transduction histidine kinase